MFIKLRKYTCFVQKSINLSFPLIWQYAPDQQKAHMTSLSKLRCGWPHLTKNMNFIHSFPSLVGKVPLGKKNDSLIPSRDIDDERIRKYD